MYIIIAALLASLEIVGVGYAPGSDTTQQPASQIQMRSIDDLLGTWEGSLDPPAEAPPGLELNFVMELEDDGDSIVGTFTITVETPEGEQSFEMEIIDGEYDDALGEFTCEMVPPEEAGSDQNGYMTATIDGDSIEGTIEGEDEETSFSGTKN